MLARFQLEQRCSAVSASGLARAPGGIARSFTVLLNCDLFFLSSPSRIFMRGFIDAPEEILGQTSFDKE